MLPDRISEVLPQGNGFLRSYVDYASQCGDAPEIYHVGVALTIFASAVAKQLACPWMAGRILVPNLYTLLVGPSRSARKTGSMDTGIDILQRVSPELVIPIPGSYEEMITQIRSTPSGLLTYREFAHFLKTTQRGYGEPIRTVLMDLYDWPPDRAYTRNLKKGKTIIEPPICLSMLSSVATELLFSFCVDDETEILTAAGWKRHEDVHTGDECYTLNHETGQGEWQHISAMNVFPGHPDREMILMEGTRGHSSLTTPNHRWPVRSKGNSSWSRRFKTTETLNQADFIQCAAEDNGLPTVPKWSDAFVELVAWIWTEGSWNPSNALGICQSSRVNPAYCERIRAALHAHLGPRHEGSMWPHHLRDVPRWVEDPPHPDTQMIHWRINQEGSRLFTEVLSIPEKVVSLSWLRTLTKAQLELFIETSFAADGFRARGRLAQASPARAEAFAFACILAGKAVSYCPIDNDHQKALEIGVMQRRQLSPIAYIERAGNRHFKVERVRHGGPIWCPTTPNGTWLARRKGSVYWTGNTDQVEWSGGFFGRFVLLYGTRETFRMPLTWPEAQSALAQSLDYYRRWQSAPCGGFDPTAWQLFAQWAQWRDSQTHTASSRVVTFISGATTLAAKIALLYAFDAGEALAGQGWLISYESMRRAIMFVDNMYMPSIIHLGERLALGPWEKDRQRVLDVIEMAGTNGVLQKDLLKRARVSLDLLDQVMNTLKAEGTATQSQGAAGIVYRRVPEGKVIPFPSGGGGQSGTNTGAGTP